MKIMGKSMIYFSREIDKWYICENTDILIALSGKNYVNDDNILWMLKMITVP